MPLVVPSHNYSVNSSQHPELSLAIVLKKRVTLMLSSCVVCGRVDNHSWWRERSASATRRQSERGTAVCQQLYAGRRQKKVSLDAHLFKGNQLFSLCRHFKPHNV